MAAVAGRAQHPSATAGPARSLRRDFLALSCRLSPERVQERMRDSSDEELAV
jgi:hypothetical protein